MLSIYTSNENRDVEIHRVGCTHAPDLALILQHYYLYVHVTLFSATNFSGATAFASYSRPVLHNESVSLFWLSTDHINFVPFPHLPLLI